MCKKLFHNRCQSGFTLAEIIVVIIILGVLAGLALPRFTGTIERMRATEGVQLLTALLGAQKAYKLETGSYTTVLDDLDITIPRADNFNTPTVANPGNPITYPIATITRTTAYILGINEEGKICCKNSGADFTCAQAGY